MSDLLCVHFPKKSTRGISAPLEAFVETSLLHSPAPDHRANCRPSKQENKGLGCTTLQINKRLLHNASTIQHRRFIEKKGGSKAAIEGRGGDQPKFDLLTDNGNWRLIFTTGDMKTQKKIGGKISYVPIKAVQVRTCFAHFSNYS